MGCHPHDPKLAAVRCHLHLQAAIYFRRLPPQDTGSEDQLGVTVLVSGKCGPKIKSQSPKCETRFAIYCI